MSEGRKEEAMVEEARSAEGEATDRPESKAVDSPGSGAAGSPGSAPNKANRGSAPDNAETTTVGEDMEGSVVFRLPFPEDIKQLKDMTPIVIKQPYQIDYLHSYGQDSPFFAGLSNGRLLGTRCQKCGYGYATPKLACMECGGDCDWEELPAEGTVHCFTVCYFGSEEFLPECPFLLALIEFEGFDTLFLTRLVGIDPNRPSMDWVGMKVKPKFRRKAKLRPTDVYFQPA